MPRTAKPAAPKRKTATQLKKEMIQKNLPNFTITADTEPNKQRALDYPTLKPAYSWKVYRASDGYQLMGGISFKAITAQRNAAKYAEWYASGERTDFDETGQRRSK